MLAYTIRRFIAGIVMLAVMSVVTFLLFYASPSDPARIACGKNCSQEQIDNARHYLGYDKSLTAQYGDLVKGLFVGRNFPDNKAQQKAAPETIIHCKAPCLGYSRNQNNLVSTVMKDRVPVTVNLVIFAFVLWITIGLAGGMVAALFRGRWPDRLLVGVALMGYSFPTFFIGLVLYNYVAIKWQLVPTPAYISPVSDPIGFLRGAILPAVTLALTLIAAYIRLTRAYVLEAMGEDYLRTARSKGLTERRILFKHTLRAALTPIATIAGLDLGVLLAGAAITETVFNFQGLGRLTVDSAVNGDLPMNVALVLSAATFVIVANILVDLLYAVIDPRVKYA
jgi:peptide/nickel transport system permease protein